MLSGVHRLRISIFSCWKVLEMLSSTSTFYIIIMKIIYTLRQNVGESRLPLSIHIHLPKFITNLIPLGFLFHSNFAMSDTVPPITFSHVNLLGFFDKNRCWTLFLKEIFPTFDFSTFILSVLSHLWCCKERKLRRSGGVTPNLLGLRRSSTISILGKL